MMNMTRVIGRELTALRTKSQEFWRLRENMMMTIHSLSLSANEVADLWSKEDALDATHSLSDERIAEYKSRQFRSLEFLDNQRHLVREYSIPTTRDSATTQRRVITDELFVDLKRLEGTRESFRKSLRNF
jgi:hypothetical protein